MLSNEQGQVLLKLARAAVAARFGSPSPQSPEEAWLKRLGATFVTLKEDGMLRGCIGSLEARRPLGEDVQHNAEAAAFRDPRFLPVTQDELERIEVEVSVLSEARPMDFFDERDALAQLQPGVDGVILEYGLHRATFLPQVWEELPQPAQFMARLKNKAGLSEGFWTDDIRLSRYSVQKFSEAG